MATIDRIAWLFFEFLMPRKVSRYENLTGIFICFIQFIKLINKENNVIIPVAFFKYFNKIISRIYFKSLEDSKTLKSIFISPERNLFKTCTIPKKKEIEVCLG